MEDAATAEISRAQIWQWIKHKIKTDKGSLISIDYFVKLLNDELKKIKKSIGEENYKNGKFSDASKIFIKLCTSEKFDDFLTISSYELLDG